METKKKIIEECIIKNNISTSPKHYNLSILLTISDIKVNEYFSTYFERLD